MAIIKQKPLERAVFCWGELDMTAEIVVKGLDKLIRKYKRLHKDAAPAIRDLTLEATTYAHGQVPPYPAPPTNSSYRRTGTTGRTITAKVKDISDHEWAGILGTPTEYAPWVISTEVGRNGAGGQAFMHRDRWWTLQGVVKAARNGIVKVYQRGIKRLLKEADN